MRYDLFVRERPTKDDCEMLHLFTGLPHADYPCAITVGEGVDIGFEPTIYIVDGECSPVHRLVGVAAIREWVEAEKKRRSAQVPT